MGCGTCGGRKASKKAHVSTVKTSPNGDKRIVTTHTKFGKFVVRPPKRNASTRTTLK